MARRTLPRHTLFAILLLALVLAACLPARQIGPRPAPDVLGSAEAYLQQYQPGPLPRVFQTTHIYDRHGVLLAERWDEGRRTWVGLSRISRHLIDATIAAEDHTFYTNPGIDAARVAGAALQNAQQKGIVSGASTITMQLARNLFLGPDERYDQTMDRKMLEVGLAQELTTLFSKDELLEMYLNLLNYGHLAYGPEAAAQVYFDKPAADLTLPEASLLAGIPQRPAELDPFQNWEAARARQRIVLDLMVRHGYLSNSAANAAFAAPLALNPRADARIDRTPHFSQYVTERVDARLGPGAATRAGMSITTTLDLHMQELAQTTLTTTVERLRHKHDLNNAALIALLPGHNQILAMVGSAGYENDAIDGQVNVTVRRRQPGSAIKPILYAAAFDDNLISPASILWDTPVSYDVGSGLTYAPANYDQRFHGPVTGRYALANSYNIPAIKLLDALGVDRMLALARAMGIASLDQTPDHYGLSLTLGGGDVTLLELTTAYAAIANSGAYVEPQALLAIVSPAGDPIPGLTSAESTAVLSPAAAFLVTDILSDNAARSPAFGPNSALQLSRPAAAKTGTTDDWRDNWTIGYTRFLIAGVWAGNSDGHPMKRSSGVTGAGPIWHDFMEAVLADPNLLATLGASADPTDWTFAPPPTVEQRPDCPPGATCRIGGEFFRQEWLAAAAESGPLADSVVFTSSAPVYVDDLEGVRWAAYCQTEPAVQRPLLRLPGRLGLSQGDESSAEPPASERRQQLQAVAWTLRHSAPISVGPCDQLDDITAKALALAPEAGDDDLDFYVDLAAAMDPNAGPVAGIILGPAAPIDNASPSRYVLAQPIEHHSDCPGNYIMGRITDANGNPVAGVHLALVDQWGNSANAISKSGASDYGLYDFPINFFANRYTLTIVDAASAPLSAPIIIDHLQAASGSAPCHTVNWIGG